MYVMRGRVRYSEVDTRGTLTIAALINYLQDSCSFDSEDEGVGLPYLRENGWGWYITNWMIELNSLPQMGDEIAVATWVYAYRGMFAYRNFLLTDANDVPLVRANAIWLLMDIRNSYPVRIPKVIIDARDTEPPIEREWGDRKIALAADFEEKNSVTVAPLHLDTNFHMNNEHYIEIARDVLPKGEKIYEIATEYKKAALLGDVLHVRRAKKDARTWQVILTGKRQNEIFAIVDFVTEMRKDRYVKAL